MILKTKLFGHTYEFKSLREVMAKANEEKSGDKLAGIAAEDAQERVAAMPASLSPDFSSLAFAMTSLSDLNS